MKRTILFLMSLPLMVAPFVSLLAKPAAALPTGSECPDNYNTEFVHAETHNFDVYICGDNFPHVYVGRAKNGNGEITIPLAQTSNRNTYVALNEDYPNIYRYVLTPHQLTVTKNGKTIVRERARWRTR